MPMRAVSPNQAMLPWPRGRTTKAASRGPIADPALPPTWKKDWAKPCRPPEAIRATRDDSGWKIDEPMPTHATAASTRPKVGAIDRSSRPTSVNVMPIASE